jgi:hypothetical protein
MHRAGQCSGITLCTCVPEVPGSNLGGDPSYEAPILRGFVQFF